MNFKNLEAHRLTKKELKNVFAGTVTDCEPGQTRVGKDGLIWVCSPTCEWVLPNPDDGDEGGQSGHGV
ncbi:hypothetical protein AAON49_13990 [Pseudotenacibaculum sp. MALMAid0570]|uniref:hypothetical protein n=1 Tax=Pseudotenacibaculum sp. MALMAid0570 TaxID=3143938 RepID=UPI0032DF7495